MMTKIGELGDLVGHDFESNPPEDVETALARFTELDGALLELFIDLMTTDSHPRPASAAYHIVKKPQWKPAVAVVFEYGEWAPVEYDFLRLESESILVGRVFRYLWSRRRQEAKTYA